MDLEKRRCLKTVCFETAPFPVRLSPFSGEAPVSRSSRVLPPDLPDIRFKFTARAHDLMAATPAAQLEVRADAQNLPLSAAAGVGLFHGENVSDLNLHSAPIS
jgi:hypothetical protein